MLFLLVFMLAGTFNQPAFALRSDKDQPTTVDADRVDVDDKKGISTFTGNVVVTRGSIRIKADKVVINRDAERGLDRVVATGNLAEYRQRPENKPVDIVANAKTITYDANKGTVLLNKQALVYQGKDTFSGDRIIYDINKDLVLAKSGDKPATTDKSGQRVHIKKERVRITIQPKKK